MRFLQRLRDFLARFRGGKRTARSEKERLSRLKEEVVRRADAAGLSRSDLPTFSTSEDFGRPHVEIDRRGFHFVVVERGQELERRTARDRNELLYWIFDAATFSEASRREVAARIEGEDSRRQLFSLHCDLLGKLEPAWRTRKEREQAAILVQHPFFDSGRS